MYNFIFIIVPELILRYFYMHETRKIFYLQKIYVFLKNLFVFRIIIHKSSINPKIPHLIKKGKTLVMSNIPSWNLSFLIYITIDTNNKPSYN